MLVDCDLIQFCHVHRNCILNFKHSQLLLRLQHYIYIETMKQKSQQPLCGEREELMRRMLYVWEQGTSPLKHHSLDQTFNMDHSQGLEIRTNDFHIVLLQLLRGLQTGAESDKICLSSEMANNSRFRDLFLNLTLSHQKKHSLNIIYFLILS